MFVMFHSQKYILPFHLDTFCFCQHTNRLTTARHKRRMIEYTFFKTFFSRISVFDISTHFFVCKSKMHTYKLAQNTNNELCTQLTWKLAVNCFSKSTFSASFLSWKHWKDKIILLRCQGLITHLSLINYNPLATWMKREKIAEEQVECKSLLREQCTNYNNTKAIIW